MQTISQRIPGERKFTLLLLVVSLCLLYIAYDIAGFSSLASAGAIPLFATSIMVVTSATTLVKSYRAKPASADESSFFSLIMPPVLCIFCVMLGIYAAIYSSLGFLFSSLLFLIVGFLVLQRSGIIRSVVMGVLLLLPIYLIFKIVFEIQLPSGILPEREMIRAITNMLSFGGSR